MDATSPQHYYVILKFAPYTYGSRQVSLIFNIYNVFIEALSKFREYNQGRLPQRIVIYRDGVGEGQLAFVYRYEVDLIKV